MFSTNDTQCDPGNNQFSITWWRKEKENIVKNKLNYKTIKYKSMIINNLPQEQNNETK